jgi:hypothetical protein
MPEPTSSGGGATLPSDPQPATGNASGGATPPKPSVTLEEALARIAELEHAHNNATGELKRHREELSTYKAAEKAKADAELSASELAKKQNAELNERLESLAAEIAEARVREAIADLASKFNFVVSAKTLANLLLADFDSIEFEDGKPTNIEKLLEKLAKAEPDLVKPQPGVPQARQAPTTPAFNPDRRSIAAPGTMPPGRIPRLNDIEWKR